jgi:host factor-I protein
MTLYLVNGVMLQGNVAGFDQFALVLQRGGQLQLVYKHAISTLAPDNPLNLSGKVPTELSTELSTETSTGEQLAETEQ